VLCGRDVNARLLRQIVHDVYEFFERPDWTPTVQIVANRSQQQHVGEVDGDDNRLDVVALELLFGHARVIGLVDPLRAHLRDGAARQARHVPARNVPLTSIVART
jgi:hypothetical protein